MSYSFNRPQAALKSHSTLVSLMQRRARVGPWLFEARGAAHQLAFEVAEEGLPAVQPVCMAIRDLFGHLLRHGVQEGDEILPAIARLLEYVGSRLKDPASFANQAPASDLSLATMPGGSGVLPLPNPARLSGARERQSRLPPVSAVAPETSAAAEARGLRLQGSEAWRMVNETRLGQILLRQGRIDCKTLDQALVIQKVGCKRLGEVLLGMGLLTDEELRGALDHQRELTLELADGMSLEGGLRIRDEELD